MIITSPDPTCNGDAVVFSPPPTVAIRLHGILADPGKVVAVLTDGRHFRMANATDVDVDKPSERLRLWNAANSEARRRERRRQRIEKQEARR